ncbi:MAG: CCA tRNA nucleotidyltransferase [Aestuariivita sp.]|nr:CCA tRNA nucleotidyltransferase [Aestuariivita sp.]
MKQINGDFLSWPETKAVFQALDVSGSKVLFVGGCIRDNLLQLPVHDVDIATDLMPTDVVSLAKANGLRTLLTGIQYGTVMVISGGKPFEVTTFRRDIKPDGRHSKVVFSKIIEEDAKRRDFTINALYATFEGKLIDPLNGLEDLKTRCLRFVGNPEKRVKEDYLRSIRLFRFFGCFHGLQMQIIPESLAAVTANLDGLLNLSKERIGAEIMKLLSAANPSDAISLMKDVGVLKRIMPGATDNVLKSLVALESTPDPVLRLAALGKKMGENLRIRRVDYCRAKKLRKLAQGMMTGAELGYRYGETDALATLTLRAAFRELQIEASEIDAVYNAAKQVFPVSASDLMPTYKGRLLGQKLNHLENEWILSRFTLNKDELLSR